MGVDLNRQWSEPSEQTMPTIYHLKRLMRSLAAQEQLLFFCDLHGHSRKRNIFVYGCEGTKGERRLKERVFPRLLDEYTPHFSAPSCSYKVLRSKETTGRVVVWRQFNLAYSFTLEASMCGPDYGALQGEWAARGSWSVEAVIFAVADRANDASLSSLAGALQLTSAG